MAAVGDNTFFFFLILMPGMGAELRASRKPSPSIAARSRRGVTQNPQLTPKRQPRVPKKAPKFSPQMAPKLSPKKTPRCPLLLTLGRDDLDFDLLGGIGCRIQGFVFLLCKRNISRKGGDAAAKGGKGGQMPGRTPKTAQQPPKISPKTLKSSLKLPKNNPSPSRAAPDSLLPLYGHWFQIVFIGG